MYTAVIIAILVVCLFAFCVWRIVKIRTAEHEEQVAEEMKKAAPDPKEAP
jgi:heme/copper-type cytochrome/quinol oxidase subunit 2